MSSLLISALDNHLQMCWATFIATLGSMWSVHLRLSMLLHAIKPQSYSPYILLVLTVHFLVTYFNILVIKDCVVPFCDEDENSIHTPEENLSENFQEPKHIVEQTWCRVLDDDLVVGVKVTSLKM